jgi:hypothetical protein
MPGESRVLAIPTSSAVLPDLSVSRIGSWRRVAMRRDNPGFAISECVFEDLFVVGNKTVRVDADFVLSA